jgi:hypothetical protein
MYVVPLGTPVIAWVGKIVIAEGPQLGNSVIVDSQARCQAHADFTDTRNTPATWQGRTPCPNISAACIRTSSRRSRPRPDRPPPSEYLIYQA